MDSKSREERIKELKALRLELMNIKEYMESDDGSSESTSVEQIRKSYFVENNTSEKNTEYEIAKQELYSQYNDVDALNHDEGDEEQLVLSRRR